MEPKFFKIPVCVGDVTLRVAKGHFATRNSHINYFIDVTPTEPPAPGSSWPCWAPWRRSSPLSRRLWSPASPRPPG